MICVVFFLTKDRFFNYNPLRICLQYNAYPGHANCYK